MGILQVLDPFFEDTAKGELPQPGHLMWVPTCDVPEVPTILDVERATPEEHFATRFVISQIANHHFNSRQRLPIKSLDLGDTEELIVNKGKKRPCIVVSGARVDDVDALPEGTARRMAKHLGRQAYFVVPLYGVSTLQNPGTFGPALVARIRAMQYPHLMCIPDHANPPQPASIARLDRMFVTTLGRGCDPYGKKLNTEALEVFLSQVSIVCGGNSSEAYETVRELAKEALPT